MDNATLKLHESLIRCAKGMFTAYQGWAKTKKDEAVLIDKPFHQEEIVMIQELRGMLAAYQEWVETKKVLK
jgi:hypothetical protein